MAKSGEEEGVRKRDKKREKARTRTGPCQGGTDLKAQKGELQRRKTKEGGASRLKPVQVRQRQCRETGRGMK